MSAPFRDGSADSDIECPRCGKTLPSTELANCPSDCGTWVIAGTAVHVFTRDELATNALVKWWRVRAPCPTCGTQMTLRNRNDDALFQGCEFHGVFVDADVIGKTSLGRMDLDEYLAAMRDAANRLRTDEERRLAAAEQSAQRQRELEEREREKERREEENRRSGERAQRAAQERARQEDLALKREAERRRVEAERAREDAERARREAAVREQAERERAQREAAEEQRRLHREQTEAFERALADKLGAKRVDVLARVNAAIEKRDGSAVVDEILDLEATLLRLTRRLELVERRLGLAD